MRLLVARAWRAVGGLVAGWEVEGGVEVDVDGGEEVEVELVVESDGRKGGGMCTMCAVPDGVRCVRWGGCCGLSGGVEFGGVVGSIAVGVASGTEKGGWSDDESVAAMEDVVEVEDLELMGLVVENKRPGRKRLAELGGNARIWEGKRIRGLVARTCPGKEVGGRDCMTNGSLTESGSSGHLSG